MLINGKKKEIRIGKATYHCAMDVTMDYIGGKWKTVLLWYLIDEKKRFGELYKMIPGITEKMLSIQLKQLEETGLIKRQVFAEVPLRVEYSLTPFGRSLIPILQEISKWGRALAYKKGRLVDAE